MNPDPIQPLTEKQLFDWLAERWGKTRMDISVDLLSKIITKNFEIRKRTSS